MASGKVKVCDKCKGQAVVMDNQIGGIGTAHWISVRRISSTSGDKIGAGTLDFCTDKCLAEYMNA